MKAFIEGVDWKRPYIVLNRLVSNPCYCCIGVFSSFCELATCGLYLNLISHSIFGYSNGKIVWG